MLCLLYSLYSLHIHSIFGAVVDDDDDVKIDSIQLKIFSFLFLANKYTHVNVNVNVNFEDKIAAIIFKQQFFQKPIGYTLSILEF